MNWSEFEVPENPKLWSVAWVIKELQDDNTQGGGNILLFAGICILEVSGRIGDKWNGTETENNNNNNVIYYNIYILSF